jgi:hypothetical protein
MNKFSFYILFFIILGAGLGCNKKGEDAVATTAETSASTASARYLYVASGTCYSGTGNTTFTATSASNIIYRVSLTNGSTLETVADYNLSSETVGSTPVSILDYDANYFYALVENGTSTGARRIEKIAKTGSFNKTTYYQNSTALSGILKSFFLGSDGTFLISKSTAIEKINTTPNRMTIGAATPWVSAPAGTCGTSATLISSIFATASGKIIFAHANATQNRFASIKSTGYSVAGDCIAGQAAPNASSFPTATVYLPDVGQVLVAYAGNAVTADLNSVYSYNLSDSTGVISGATKSYEDVNILYGISAMAVDTSTGYIYIATANGTSTTVGGYNIEKFSYDSTSKALTRIGTVPFSPHTYKSKCISSMFVGY